MEKKYFRLNGELDTNVGVEKISVVLKRIMKWLLPIPLLLSAMHPIINFGVINNYPPKMRVTVELKGAIPEKQPKLNKRKAPVQKKRKKCDCR